MPGGEYPKELLSSLQHGESLKSRMCKRICAIVVVPRFDPFHLCIALIIPNIMKGRTTQANK